MHKFAATVGCLLTAAKNDNYGVPVHAPYKFKRLRGGVGSSCTQKVSWPIPQTAGTQGSHSTPRTQSVNSAQPDAMVKVSDVEVITLMVLDVLCKEVSRKVKQPIEKHKDPVKAKFLVSNS